MPFEYWIDPHQDLLVTTLRGTMTDGEILRYVEQLVSDQAWRSGMNGFVDLQEIGHIEVTGDGIKHASKLAMKNEDRFRGSRWAVLTDKDAIFGIARMYELQRNAQSYEVRAFREPESAFDWLGVDPPISPTPS